MRSRLWRSNTAGDVGNCLGLSNTFPQCSGVHRCVAWLGQVSNKPKQLLPVAAGRRIHHDCQRAVLQPSFVCLSERQQLEAALSLGSVGTASQLRHEPLFHCLDWRCRPTTAIRVTDLSGGKLALKEAVSCIKG